MKDSRVLISAGGTGGHIFPALAIANNLKERGWNIHWVLGGALAKKINLEHNFDFTEIKMSGINNNTFYEKSIVVLKLLYFTIASLKVIYRIKPKVVISFGGYTSAPVGLAATLLRTPLIIHEQNCIAGKVTRLLHLFSHKSLISFKPTIGIDGDKQIYVGNPLRKKLVDTSKKTSVKKNEGKLKILVLGGSQGSMALNQIVANSLPFMFQQQKIEFVHQCGISHMQTLLSLYKKHGLNDKTDGFKLVDFIQSIGKTYQWASLAIARAGAMTLSELALFSLPAILIPLPSAANGHQLKNAQYYSERKCAIVMDQKACNTKKIIELVDSFCSPAGREKLRLMSENIAKLATPNATTNFINLISTIVAK